MKQIKENGTSRRDFLNKIIGGGVFAWFAAVIYPLFAFLDPPKTKEVKVSQVTIGKIDDMAKDSSKIIKFGEKPVIVIRKDTGDYVAYTAICTHLDCTVQYRKDYGQIYCACHNGRYDLNGKVVSGPPPAPLAKFEVTIRGDEVIVHKMAEQA